MKERDLTDEKLLRYGLIGSGITAICGFTAVLMVIAAGVGLRAIVGWLDYGLVALLFSLGFRYALAGRPAFTDALQSERAPRPIPDA